MPKLAGFGILIGIGLALTQPASAASFAFSFDNSGLGGGPVGVVISGLASFTAGLSDQPGDFDAPSVDDIVFIPLDDAVAPVPLPAGLPLMVVALGLVGLAARRGRT